MKLHQLAYFFESRTRPASVYQEARLAGEMVDQWRVGFWSSAMPQLVLEQDNGEQVIIRDTRPCTVETRHILHGVEAALIRHLDSPVSRDGLSSRLKRRGSTTVSKDVIAAALSVLDRLRLVWISETQVIALPTVAPIRPMPEVNDRMGKVDHVEFLRDQLRFKQLFA
jgi:hypothetical protein